jgi:hypothetical protein
VDAIKRNLYFDEARAEPLAEELHQGFAIPVRERVESAVLREGAVGYENVTMRMSLQKVA